MVAVAGAAGSTSMLMKPPLRTSHKSRQTPLLIMHLAMTKAVCHEAPLWPPFLLVSCRNITLIPSKWCRCKTLFQAQPWAQHRVLAPCQFQISPCTKFNSFKMEPSSSRKLSLCALCQLFPFTLNHHKFMASGSRIVNQNCTV